MWKILICAFLFQRFEGVLSSVKSIPLIHNVSLVMFNSNSTIINGTCQQCLCNVLLNITSFLSFNCFSSNNTCEMFSQSLKTGSFMLVNNTASSFYFFSWPIDDTTLATNEITTTTMQSYVEYLWTFDSTYQDLSSIFNATPMNGVGFNSSTITGYGSSLSLTSTLSQWVQMDTPFLNLSDHSWTFEAWIYLSTVTTSVNYAIVGQCESANTNKCFHLVIRNQKMYLGFYNNDLIGVTSLALSEWYHVAYVFDSLSLNQSVYLNGVLDNSTTTNSSYHGNNGSLTVGMTLLHPYTYFFGGLIDQLYYINRAKSSTEILNDATLTLYFSFDNGSIYDSGPLRINGSLFGSTSVVAGRTGDALQFGPSTNSYFCVSGLVLLGVSNQSYSMSIWIKPTIINASSIIHVSSESNGAGWCLEMLSMNSSGQLIAASYDGGSISIVGPYLTTNNWTHAVITYSTVNGLYLYINGDFQNFTPPFSYVASGSQNYIFLANSLNGTTCIGNQGQFFGALDEFRLYSRELTATDVWTLFNL